MQAGKFKGPLKSPRPVEAVCSAADCIYFECAIESQPPVCLCSNMYRSHVPRTVKCTLYHMDWARKQSQARPRT